MHDPWQNDPDRTTRRETPIPTHSRAAAWDVLMAMWEDPENAEDLNGGDVVETIGVLRREMGYSE